MIMDVETGDHKGDIQGRRILRVAHFTDREFAEVFKRDLRGAAASVRLCSPFVSTSRTGSYAPCLAVLRHRGISVEIVVRPKAEQPALLQAGFDAALTRLRQSASTVELRTGIHQKIATIDDRIL